MSNLTTSPAGRRILALLDENSFVEIGAEVRARSTDFTVDQGESKPGDGVITGYGSIEGALVYVFSQDSSAFGGSVGEMHARKITRLYELAMKTGAPVIALLDSTGIRINESTDALFALGSVYASQADLSGVAPQIAAVFGECGGGLSLIAANADFTFMESAKGKLFVSSPDSIEGNYEEKLDTSSASYQAEWGSVDVVAEGEDALIAKIRELIPFLPSNFETEAYNGDASDDLNRISADMSSCAKDTVLALQRIADDNVFYELGNAYAKSMVTGFIRLNGATVGAIANRGAITKEDGKTEDLKQVLTVHGAQKAADFVNFCDAFNIPILTLTNVNGFCNCPGNPKHMSQAASRLLMAFAGATVPRVNVIVGEAFTSAALLMNSKSTGSDYTYAWSGAKIGAIDGKHAADILFDGKDASEKKEKAAAYDELQASSASAAARGYVDTIIDPAETRKYVVGAFEMLFSKDIAAPDKKHGTH
ncbi:MAG: carboxyl transferase [Lachnospiraceae bacterium]|nr:carboxyl transferase [Lachnospiraceae bacterium]